MHFTGQITPGDILVAITIVVSIFGAYNKLSVQIGKIAEKYEPVYKWWDRHINTDNGRVKQEWGD